MDIPFISSGAVNRAHYGLVRNVESTSSVQAANQYLSAEIKSIHRQLAEPGISLESRKDCLIILLYCHTTITHVELPHNTFDFALPHAIGLAEAGRTATQKRIGYLYCAEVMPPNHELQLMLINTLRKDLEHESVARICLALDMIIVSRNDDLVPAIQDRLLGLLSHTSPHVRRRALTVFRALARQRRELSSRFSRKIAERLEDPDLKVVQAALRASLNVAEPVGDLKSIANNLLKAASANLWEYDRSFLLTLVQSLFDVGLADDTVPAVLTLVRSSVRSKDYSTLREAFLLLSKVTPTTLLSSTSSLDNSPVADIRSFLVSSDPNEIYLFFSCLECLDPSAWAGTTPDSPAVLESQEVEHIMQQLESKDTLIRRKTIYILNRVDPNIVTSYKSRAIATIPHGLSITASNECAFRLLEVVEIQSDQDGELYAREVKDVLVQFEAASGSNLPVLEAAVETVLLRVRYADLSFRIGCATTLVTITVEADSRLPQTIIVIAAALATEFCGQLAMSPIGILTGFAAKLPSCLITVQDACLLAMLRIAAECNEVPVEIVNAVTDLGKQSSRHIRRRCEQFITMAPQRPMLVHIIASARSSSLPDFLAALQDHAAGKTLSPPLPTTRSSSSQSFISSGQLRYKAYDTPPPASQVRSRSRSSRSQSSSRATSSDPLSRTLTPGQLTLAVADAQGLEVIAKTLDTNPASSGEVLIDELEHRVNLISLDSPFVSDPNGQNEFEEIWSANERGEIRGWQQSTIKNVVQQLEKMALNRLKIVSADDAQSPGDLKVLVGSDGALRLRESDEGGCLWRFRSTDKGLLGEVRQVLA